MARIELEELTPLEISLRCSLIFVMEQPVSSVLFPCMTSDHFEAKLEVSQSWMKNIACLCRI